MRHTLARSNVQRPLTIATAALLAAALAMPALAQQQVNTGNRLDANQQAGTGGINPGAAQIDFQARNLLITGQVGDARQFRGDVGYGAAGAFGGQLGSDDLFRFRADSYNANRSYAPPIPGAGPRSGQPVIYNDFFNPGVGSAQPNVARTVINQDGSRSVVNNPTGNVYNPDLLGGIAAQRPYTSPADAYQQGSTNNAGLGLYQQADGAMLRLDANPLFGVRQTALTPGSLAPTGAPTTPGSSPAGLDTESAPDNLMQARIEPTTPGSALNTDPRVNGALQPGQTGAIVNPAGSNAPALPGLVQPAKTTPRNRPGTLPTIDSASNLSPTQQIGLRLTPAAAIGQTNRGQGGDDQRLQRLGTSIFNPDKLAKADEEQVEASSYLTLLTRIREQAAARVGQPVADNADQPADNQAGAQRDALPRPAWMRSIEDPEADMIKQAEERRLGTLSRLLELERQNRVASERGELLPQWRPGTNPLNPAGGDANNPDAGNAAAPGADRPDRVGVNRSDTLQSLIRQLSYDLPRVETLKGNRETRVNETFAKAEDALAKGNYFDAEAMYRQLILDAPDNPLARVGQVHAEMGAGMVRSAAFHLRQLFDQHAELISTRYAQNLLPPSDRLKWLQQELQKAIDAQDQSNLEPGLLMAYLGWQVESRQLTRYGLAIAQEAAPADPLLALLRQVWLGEEE